MLVISCIICSGYTNSNYKELEEPLVYLEENKPDAELYWEMWDEVLNNFWFKDKTGTKYLLYQNQDLWAVPEHSMEKIEMS